MAKRKKKKKRRAYNRVNPSIELLRRLEETILELLRDRGGKEFWTHIFKHIDETFIQIHDPVEHEWIKLTNYGRGKTLAGVMDSLVDRSIVTRKKNYHPYILTSVLDRIVKELDKSEGESHQTGQA